MLWETSGSRSGPGRPEPLYPTARAIRPIAPRTEMIRTAFRVDYADVVGGEALAEQARVEGVDRLVGEVGGALVALDVRHPRDFDELVDLRLVGGQVDLDLVDDVAKHLVDAGVDHLAEVLQAEALGEGVLAH